GTSSPVLEKKTLSFSSGGIKTSRNSTTLAQLSSTTSLPNTDSSPPSSSLISSSSSPTTESLLYTSDTQAEQTQDPNTKNGNLFTGLKTSNELPSHSYNTVVCSDDGLYYFGGNLHDGSFTNDLYFFHFSMKQWNQVTFGNGPAMRTQHSSILWNNSMYIFGGRNASGPKNDLYVYSFETQLWSEVPTEGAKPTARFGHSAIVDDNHMIVFGGIGVGEQSQQQAINELYSLNLETKVWSLIISPAVPTPRAFHTATFYKGQMWVIGGQDAQTNLLDEIYTFSTTSNTWSKIQLEGSSSLFTARSSHTASLLQDSIIITGGNTKSNPSSLEIFEIDLFQKKMYKIQTTNQGQSRVGHTSIVKNSTLFIWGGGESSIDYFSFGKDEFEEDFVEDDYELTRLQNIPKIMWEASLMKKHPEILDLRERTQMLSGIKSYAKTLAMPSFTENKNSLSHQIVLQLIMEYLERHTDYHKAIKAIQNESGILHQPTESGESRLVSLLRLAKPRLRNKNVFDTDLDVFSKEEGNNDPEVQVVDHLYSRNDENEEEDINVWEEGEDTTRNIRKTEADGKLTIKAATLNKLIHYLAPEKEKKHDVNLMKAFLYTHTSFTTSENLLKKLIQRYSVPNNNNDPVYKREVVDPIRSRVCGVLKYWIDKCSWDFKSGPGADKLVAAINNFIDGSLTRDANPNIKKLRSLLNQVRTTDSIYSSDPPEPKVPKNIFSPQLSLAHIDELEIARQMTLIEYRLFRNIPPPEFLIRITSFGEFQYNMANSPNLVTLLNRTTDVSRWVVYTVLNSDSKKSRAKMVEKFIKTIECLRNLNNYQTMYSIFLGFSNPLLQAMPDLFTPRHKEIIADLENLFSKTDNYKNYRDALLKSPSPPIGVGIIPLVLVLQEEIASIESQTPSMMNNLINFVKRQNLYNVISKIEEYQLRPYNLQPVHQISTFINKIQKVSDAELTELAGKIIN
ncbi:hypothetical protein CYY_009983, partial [Polysphondylium violaceum]